jgi:hypothetical protein
VDTYHPVALTFGFLRVAHYVVNLDVGYVDLFGLSHYLGLPRAVTLGIVTVLTGISVYLALRLNPQPELLLLSVTSILALTIFYHLSYDCIVLIFPAVYLAQFFENANVSHKERVFAYSAVVMIVMTWFVHKAIALAYHMNAQLFVPSYRMPSSLGFYVLLYVASYVALADGLCQLWKARQR